MTEAPDNPILHSAIEALLLERGVLTVAELVDALNESSSDLGRDPDSAVLDAMYASFETPFTRLGLRWAHLPALLHGRIFTRRATGPELDHDLSHRSSSPRTPLQRCSRPWRRTSRTTSKSGSTCPSRP